MRWRWLATIGWHVGVLPALLGGCGGSVARSPDDGSDGAVSGGGSNGAGGDGARGGSEPTGGGGPNADGAAGGEPPATTNGSCSGEPLADPASFGTWPSTCQVASLSGTSNVDLVVLLDRGDSMLADGDGTESRWGAVTKAVEAFVESSDARGLQLGLVLQSASRTDADGTDCSAATYADPVVPLGPIDDAGPAAVQALQGTEPGGGEALVPAVQGALAYVRQLAAASSSERVGALAIVTGGSASQCGAVDPSVAEVAIADAYRSENVTTFVVSLGDAPRSDLDAWAIAGASEAPILVADDDVEGGLTAALRAIARTGETCAYFHIRPPLGYDGDWYSALVRAATPENDTVLVAGPVASAADCAAGGWYGNYEEVNLCPCSCEASRGLEHELWIGCVDPGR